MKKFNILTFKYLTTGNILKQTSLDESVQMDTPPRSPLEPSADELHEILPPIIAPINEGPEMTPKQRWHVAINKIIMQLNVCNSDYNIKLMLFNI